MKTEIIYELTQTIRTFKDLKDIVNILNDKLCDTDSVNIENLNYAQYVIKIERTTADRVDEKKFKFKKCADKKSA